ncbi:hypothetical protein Vi05172_g3380 [Venturia inaequalis]|nr:hypothetical protein Vi05172_g3380 [Venturia inaequalis]
MRKKALWRWTIEGLFPTPKSGTKRKGDLPWKLEAMSCLAQRMKVAGVGAEAAHLTSRRAVLG